MARGKRDYLFKRSGSDNWWIKLQPPDEKKIERSLGTPDRREAEIKAMPLIEEHRRKLWAHANGQAKRFLDTGERYLAWKPGVHDLGSGESAIATPDTVFFRDASGQIVREQPNMVMRGVTCDFDPKLWCTPGPIRPKRDTKDDEVLVETYIRHAALKGYLATECRSVFKTFQEAVGKPFKDSDRDDGRKLAQLYFDQGNKSATVAKKVGWLRAVCKLAIDDGKLKSINPFSGVVAKVEDAMERIPLDDDDMTAIQPLLDDLSDEDRLLWKMLAHTGMRLSEAFQITEEFRESQKRFVIIGSKTDSSRRRVPLPEAVLPDLPAKILRPLFEGTEAAASKRLNRLIDRAGVLDERKSLHCLRHRAKDRLRIVQCPLDIQLQLLGHEERTVADNYGRGSPVAVLKKWIDKI